jgi:predicted transcriptional regulator
MSTVKEIEEAIVKLSPEELAAVREFVEQVAEDQLELTDEFKAAIEAGERDIAAGRVRIRQVEVKP